MEEFEIRFKNKYGEAINKLNELSNMINEKKERLEKCKYTYFESYKSSLELENKITQLQDSKLNNKDELSKINEQLTKSLKILEGDEQLYKEEIRKMNKIYEDNEENYSNIVKRLRNINIEKIEFFSKEIKNIILNLSQLLKNENDLISKIDKITDNIKVNRDIILYDEKFNFHSNKKRFLLEQFLDLKKFKKLNFESKINTTSDYSINNINQTIGNIFGFFRGNSGSNNDNNNNNNANDKNNNLEEKLKKDIREKILSLGNNNDSFIAKDEKAKEDSLFLNQLLFNKEKINDTDYNNYLTNTLKQRKIGKAYEIWKLGMLSQMIEKYPDTPENACPELYPKKKTIPMPNFLKDKYLKREGVIK
jgi:hypothetical protein